jgi:hypothetical protein
MFHKLTSRLNWIKPENLDIDPRFYNENLWETTFECLKKMDFEKSPCDKLKCVLNVHRILCNSISFSSGKEKSAGADEICSIFIYVIIKSQPKRFVSNIQYTYIYFITNN